MNPKTNFEMGRDDNQYNSFYVQKSGQLDKTMFKSIFALCIDTQIILIKILENRKVWKFKVQNYNIIYC